MYSEINGSEEQRSEFGAIKDAAALEAFLKKHDCGASADEFTGYVRSQTEGEMTDDAAENVAGGLPRLLFSE